MRTGFVPQNNSAPNCPAGDPEMDASKCPKCDVEMERIETNAEGPDVRELQLCPKCYLVTWSDHDGLHLRQGVAMNRGTQPPSMPSPWSSADPKDC
jgi:hypothetical protein